jgi:hypothetical protein
VRHEAGAASSWRMYCEELIVFGDGGFGDVRGDVWRTWMLRWERIIWRAQEGLAACGPCSDVQPRGAPAAEVRLGIKCVVLLIASGPGVGFLLQVSHINLVR